MLPGTSRMMPGTRMMARFGETMNVVQGGNAAELCAVNLLSQIVHGAGVELTERGLKHFQDLHERHGVELFGPKTSEEKAGVFSFVVPDVRHDVASKVLSEEFGIATRNGCFCAHPLLHRLLGLGDTSAWTDALSRGEDVDLPGATRATIGVYQTEADVDLLAQAIDVVARKAWKGEHNSAPAAKSIEVS